jgi:hypothetical protein
LNEYPLAPALMRRAATSLAAVVIVYPRALSGAVAA